MKEMQNITGEITIDTGKATGSLSPVANSASQR